MKVTSWSFYVGQGTANLLLIETAAEKKSILIDCGTSNGSCPQPQQSATEKIVALTGGKLDLLILSHTDQDHINLILEMLLEGAVTKVGEVVIGGASKGITDISEVVGISPGMPRQSPTAKPTGIFISLIAELQKLKEEGGCGKISFMADPDYVQSLLSVVEGPQCCNIRLLACRSCSEVSKSHFINSNSAVVVCEYCCGENTVNICYGGDATYETFEAINGRIGKAREGEVNPYQRLTGGFYNVLIAPHHGAVITSCKGENLVVGGKLSEQLEQAGTFAEYIRAKLVYVSAYYPIYKWHPCIDMVDVYARHVNTGTNKHFYTGVKMHLRDGMVEDKNRDIKCFEMVSDLYSSFSFAQDVNVPNAFLEENAANCSALNQTPQTLCDLEFVLSDGQGHYAIHEA